MNLRQECLNKIEEAYQIAEQRYGKTFTRPQVVFKKRGRTAGTALFNHITNVHVIDLNAGLLESEGQKFIERTPAHEAAHLISREHFGPRGRGHGPEWKSVMRVLGQEPTRCHDYDVSAVVKGHSYKCQTCGKVHTLSTMKHNKIRRGVTYWCASTYACRSAKKALVKI